MLPQSSIELLQSEGLELALFSGSNDETKWEVVCLPARRNIPNRVHVETMNSVQDLHPPHPTDVGGFYGSAAYSEIGFPFEQDFREEVRFNKLPHGFTSANISISKEDDRHEDNDNGRTREREGLIPFQRENVTIMECFIAVPASDEKTFPHGLRKGAGIFDRLVLLCRAVKRSDPGHFGQACGLIFSGHNDTSDVSVNQPLLKLTQLFYCPKVCDDDLAF